MPNEFLNNRKRTFCLRSKKCCTVSYYKKKCQKESEIQMIERKMVNSDERKHRGRILITKRYVYMVVGPS